MDGDGNSKRISKFFRIHDKREEQQNLPSKIQKVSVTADNSKGLESGDDFRRCIHSMRAVIQNSGDDFKRTILACNDTESGLQKALANECSRMKESYDRLDRLCKIAKEHEEKLIEEKAGLTAKLKTLGEGLQTPDM